MKHIRVGLAVALTVTAVSIPTAQAMVVGDGSGPSVTPAPTISPRHAPPLVRLDGVLPRPQAIAEATPPAETGSFDWADAGVGFGTAGGLALAGGGLLVAARRQRRHVPSR